MLVVWAGLCPLGNPYHDDFSHGEAGRLHNSPDSLRVSVVSDCDICGASDVDLVYYIMCWLYGK